MRGQSCESSALAFGSSRAAKAARHVATIAIAIALAAAAACGDDDARAPDLGDGGAGTDPSDVPPGKDAEPIRAEFGLDGRPSNTTCLAPARPPPAADVKLEHVYTNVALEMPMMMVQRPGDGSRWFVAQRRGKIVSFPSASPPAQPDVVADVVALSGKPIYTDFEAGLLGLAFHPSFAQNGRLYVSFVTSGDAGGYASEVGYLTSTDNGASFTSYTRVLYFPRPRLEHNGGGIQFGKDGYLYLSFGDGTNPLNGQDPSGFFAKILRIDVDNPAPGKAYGVPPTNPFAAGGGEPATYARGFRNPFRFSIDRATGDVWVGDVGDATWEEINKVERGGNYGWPCREGSSVHPNTNPAACPSMAGLVDPVVEHQHATPNSRSIIGGVVYRGSAIPGFQGTYLYSDFIQLELWGLSFDPATGAPTTVQLNPNGPQAGWGHFAEDQDGEVYLVATFQNMIHKLVPAGATGPSTFPDRLSKTGCVDPADPKLPAAGLVPYGVNAQLWSDGAAKERWLALPDGATIAVKEDGDLELPVGSVLVKMFWLGGKRVETRLLVRHDDGEWAGYSYEWDEAQTDAVLLPSGKSRPAAGQTWTYPSRTDCVRCHTAAAGRTLGPELGQLNGDFVYPSTGRIANQLTTLDHIGLFTAPLGEPAAELAAYPDPFGAAPLEARARAYLHSNCAGCHRPNGGAARSNLDLRFGTPLAQTNACGIASELDDLGIPDAKLVAPGAPERSILSRRVHATDAKRMPPLGRDLVDEEGAALIDDWIRRLAACP